LGLAATWREESFFLGGGGKRGNRGQIERGGRNLLRKRG
jgi:hypothetical protein